MDEPEIVTTVAAREGVHPETVKRWIKKGLEIEEGVTVFLAFVKQGRKYAVRPSALKKFYERTQGVRSK